MKEKILKLVVLSVMLSAFSCDLFIKPVEKPTDSKMYEQIADEFSAAYDSSVLASGVSQGDVDTLVAASKSAVVEAKLQNSTNPGDILPVMVKGIMAAMPDGVSISGNKNAVLAITEATAVAAVEAAAKRSDKIGIARNARSISGLPIDDLLSYITEDLLSNIDSLGLSNDDIGDVSGNIIGTIVATLDVEVEGRTLTTSVSVSTAVKSVVEAGVRTIALNASISVETKKSVMGTVTKKAVEAVQKVDNVDDKNDLVGGVARQAVATSIEVATSQSIEVSSVIKVVTEGAAAGAIDSIVHSVEQSSALSIIVKQSAKEAISNENIGESEKADIITDVASSVTSTVVENTMSSSEQADALLISVVALEEVKVEVENTTYIADSETVAQAIQISVEETTAVTISYDNTAVQAAAALAAKRETNAPVQVSVVVEPDSEAPYVINEDTDLYITATITDADATDLYTAKWTEATGSVVIDTPNADAIHVVPAYPGTYTFTLTVTELWNETLTDSDITNTEVVEIEVTVNQVGDPLDNAALSVEAVERGKLKIESLQFEGALSDFETAINLDETNEEAKIWWSFLNIATIVVDPAIQQVAEDMGIIGYPETVADVLSNEWMTQSVYNGGYYESIYDEFGNYDGEYYVPYAPVMLPRVKVPMEYYNSALSHYDDPNGIQLDLVEYVFAVLHNLTINNPNGLNSFMDNILSTAANRFISSAEMLNTVSDTAGITFTKDMLPNSENANFWPKRDKLDADGKQILVDGVPVQEDADYTIGKAEVTAYGSTLELISSIIKIFQATSLDFNAKEVFDLLNPINGKAYTFYTNDRSEPSFRPNIEFDWASVQSPLSLGVLQARQDAAVILSGAKTSFVNAMNGYRHAITLLEQRTADADDSFFLGANSWDNSVAKAWMSDVLPYVTVGKNMLTKVVESANEGKTLFLAQDMTNIASDSAVRTKYENIENWPNAVDFTSETNQVFGVNVNVLFEKALLDVSNFFELDADGEPVWYKMSSDTDGALNGATRVTGTPEELAYMKENLSGFCTYYNRLPDATFGGLIATGDDSKAYKDLINGYAQMLITMMNNYVENPSEAYVTQTDEGLSVYAKITGEYTPMYAPYLSLAPAGTAITASDDPVQLETTGSFWTGIIPTVSMQPYKATIAVGEWRNYLESELDADEYTSERIKITGLDPTKTYFATAKAFDSAVYDSGLSFYDSNEGYFGSVDYNDYRINEVARDIIIDGYNYIVYEITGIDYLIVEVGIDEYSFSGPLVYPANPLDPTYSFIVNEKLTSATVDQTALSEKQAANTAMTATAGSYSATASEGSMVSFPALIADSDTNDNYRIEWIDSTGTLEFYSMDYSPNVGQVSSIAAGTYTVTATIYEQWFLDGQYIDAPLSPVVLEFPITVEAAAP